MTQQNPLSFVEPWDLVAEGYAADAHARLMEAFAARALELAPVGPGARVIDVAAGVGALSLLASARAADVHAIDFSELMLAELGRRAAARGLTNVRALVGDGQHLPYAAGSFDAAFSMFGVIFFPDRSRGFAELRRVLRPGGTAVVSSWTPADESPLMTVLSAAVRAGDPDVAPRERDPLSLDRPERLARAMRHAGFVEVLVHAHSAALEAESPAAAWECLVASSPPLAMRRKQLGAAAWEARAAKSRRYLEENLGPGPVRLPTTALLGVGRSS